MEEGVFQLVPDGFKLFHIDKREIEGAIAHVYFMGLEGDIKKFIKLISNVEMKEFGRKK